MLRGDRAGNLAWVQVSIGHRQSCVARVDLRGKSVQILPEIGDNGQHIVRGRKEAVWEMSQRHFRLP